VLPCLLAQFDKDVALPSARSTGRFLADAVVRVDGLADLLKRYGEGGWRDAAEGAGALRSLAETLPRAEARVLAELADLIARLEAAATQGARFRLTLTK
jgi:hypothetical protein